MVRLKSDSGNYYEFDPNNALGRGGYWSCYIGIRISGIIPVQVKIYSILPELDISECFLGWLKNIPKFILNHPNIISPIDYVEEFEPPSSIKKRLYVIENVHNSVSLSDLLQDQSNGTFRYVDYAAKMYRSWLDNRTFFSRIVARELLKVLGQLHNKGIIIGCIDPDFILFTDDNKIKIKFIETFHWFNVRHAIDSERINPQYTMISLIGAISGKYEDIVAPELLGHYYTDARSDLYSMGVILYYLVTGHLPFHNNNDTMISLNQDIPLNEIEDKQLRRTIKKATEKNPAKRFQSAREFIDELDESVSTRVLW